MAADATQRLLQVSETPSGSYGSPPARGISLGWHFAILTALILTVVMGAVIVFQQRHEIAMERRAREGLLRESLAPLVYNLASVENQAGLREAVNAFCKAFASAGYPSHHLELRDSEGRAVVSTSPMSSARPEKFLMVSVPVASPALEGQRGTVILRDDPSEYDQMVSRQRRSWLLHLAVTVVPIFAFVMLAIRFVVTRPLENLLGRVRKMEMGYWDQPLFEEGPWEIRWLGWRFRNLGLELKNTVEQLLRAERRALQEPLPEASKSRAMQPLVGASVSGLPGGDKYRARCEDLRRECQELVSMDAADPRVSALARKVWEKDASEAGRLGDMNLKGALEDASMRILEPSAFFDLERRLASNNDSAAAWIAQREADMRRGLDEKGILCVEVAHRVKHLAGIWKKMRLKELELDEIDDLYAFRIIVPTEPDCYLALGAIHEIFHPIVGRFNDYIAFPKPNGYQSIHTCVRAEGGPVFEIQIRSTAMHYEAERGCAAHWMYKRQQVVSVSDGFGLSAAVRRFSSILKRRDGAQS
jgi:ppGpp synthetase/RelA/SpoT-type nucleotidyltranferase